jgi:hypothetical protein
MNKEIIHQTAQAHAENLFIQPLNAQGVMSIPTGHTVPYGYRKHTNWLKNILKPVLWYQQQQTSCKAFD